MKFVEGWRGAWRWFSVQALALAGIWEGVKQSPEALAVIPDQIEGHITLVLIVAAGIGRLIQQGGKK